MKKNHYNIDYKGNFFGIVESVEKFLKDADEICMEYYKEHEELENKLINEKTKYKDEYLNQVRENWKPSKDYGAILGKLREDTLAKVDSYFEQIDLGVTEFINEPLTMELYYKLNALKKIGVHSLPVEVIEHLKVYCNSYIDFKILQGYAKHMRNDKGEKIPYRISVLEIDGITKAKNDFKSNVNIIIGFYQTENGRFFNDLARICLEYRNKTEKYRLHPMEIEQYIPLSGTAIGHSKRFGKMDSYKNFEKRIDEIVATLKKYEIKKRTLTSEDIAFIDKMVSYDYDRYKTLAIGKAKELSENDPYMANLLCNDFRYKEDVLEHLEKIGKIA